MLKYKIVATDLDGTLLDHDCRVSAENFAAIHALVEKGVHCAIATGRTLNEIPKEILACEDLRYIIYSNGAMVLDKAEDRRISACIDRKNILRMMDIFADYKVHISVRYDGTCYTDATLPLVENAEYIEDGKKKVDLLTPNGAQTFEFSHTIFTNSVEKGFFMGYNLQKSKFIGGAGLITMQAICYSLIGLSTLLTVLSGINYFVKNKGVIATK